MRMFDAALSAATALTWYHLSPERQYAEGNVRRYHDLAILSGRTEYAERVADITGEVNGPLLEIGAGTGLVSRTLAKRHGDRLLCTDIEPAVLAFNPHTRTRVADCRDLPLENASMAAIVGVGVYRYLKSETVGDFWTEMRRVIRASGKLVLGEFHPRFIGIRGSEVNAADARGLFSFHTCHLNPAYARLGKRVLRIGTNVTYTFLPE